MNIIIGLKFFVLNIIFLILAAHIERSKIFDIIVAKIIKIRYSLNFIITFFFLFSPLFLFPVFIDIARKIYNKSNKNEIIYSYLLISILIGSILSPIGNQRNLFIMSYISSYYPEGFKMLEFFLKNTFFIWLFALLLLNIISFFTKYKFEGNIETERFRYKELLFFIVSLILVIPFGMGKLNFAGFSFLILFFMFAFTSFETLKITKWIYLIPSFIVIPLSIIPSNFPLNIGGHLKILSSSFLASGIITSNFSSVLFSSPELSNMANIIKGVSAGSLIPFIGSFEIIYIKFFKKERINPFVFIIFSVICFLIGLIIK